MEKTSTELHNFFSGLHEEQIKYASKILKNRVQTSNPKIKNQKPIPVQYTGFSSISLNLT